MEKKTFHQANIETLKKIGITNIYNVLTERGTYDTTSIE